MVRARGLEMLVTALISWGAARAYILSTETRSQKPIKPEASSQQLPSNFTNVPQAGFTPSPARSIKIALGPLPFETHSGTMRITLARPARTRPARDVELLENDKAVVTKKAPEAPTQTTEPPLQQLALQDTPKPKVLGSAWILARNGGDAASLARSGQLGGSQIGIRILQPIFGGSGRYSLNATGRLSAPLKFREGKEAAIGLAVRKNGVIPVELGFERRFTLDRYGRNAFALIAASGISDFPVTKGLTLTGYGQTGIVGFRSKDFFADGALSLDHPIGQSKSAPFSLGAAIWGATQPGSSRIDIGPQVTVRLLKTPTPMRISAQWRFRIDGKAQPASGPAITIGTDF